MGQWELSVEGRDGVILRGTGSRLKYDWNGVLNGKRLPEGGYRLRLKAAGSSDRTAETILDVTPPEVTNLMITDIIQQADGDRFDYTIGLDAVDKTRYRLNASAGYDPNAVSGLDPSTVQLDRESTNAQFKNLSREKAPTPNRFKLVEQCQLSDPKELKYAATARDRAGNTGRATETLYESLGFAGVDVRSLHLYSGQSYPSSSYRVSTTERARAFVLAAPGVIAGASTELLPLIALIVRTAAAAIGGTAVATQEGDSRNDGTGTAPVADRAVDGSVPLPEWNTPFVYPGKALRYFVGFLNVDKNQREAKVQLNIELNATVALISQETGQVVYTLPSMRLSNMKLNEKDSPSAFRSFDWNGQSQDGVSLPTGKYQVLMMIHDGKGSLPRLSPNSPNVPYKSKWPPGFDKMLQENKRLHGLRVINNNDGKHTPFRGGGPFSLVGAYETDWKSFIGPAGSPNGGSNSIKTHDWHHIVEETQVQFPIDKLVSTRNLVRLVKRKHQAITEFYRNPQPGYQAINNRGVDIDLSLRAWLRKHYSKQSDFDFHHQLGLKILLNEFEWEPSMQGD